MSATTKIQVSNPYPEWQSMAGDMNCWNCYKLLWHRVDTLKHLCNDCQKTHVAVEYREQPEADFDCGSSALHPSTYYRNNDDHPFDGVEPGLGRIEDDCGFVRTDGEAGGFFWCVCVENCNCEHCAVSYQPTEEELDAHYKAIAEPYKGAL